MLMLKMLTNLLASNISIKYNLKGPLLSPTLACATGLNAIGESFNLIQNNKADIMICGGSEAAKVNEFGSVPFVPMSELLAIIYVYYAIIYFILNQEIFVLTDSFKQ